MGFTLSGNILAPSFFSRRYTTAAEARQRKLLTSSAQYYAIFLAVANLIPSLCLCPETPALSYIDGAVFELSWRLVSASGRLALSCPMLDVRRSKPKQQVEPLHIVERGPRPKNSHALSPIAR